MKDAMIQSGGAGWGRRDSVFVLALCALAVVFSWAAWCRLPSFWGDHARWLFETYRLYLGDVPYRDVASLYPPLSLYVYALAYQVFGQTFAVAHVLTSVLCVAALVSTYALARTLLPAPISMAAVLCLTAAGASSETSFALFRLGIYTPSVLTAACGLNLYLLALNSAVRSGTLRPALVWFATLGATLCMLSRIEFALAVGFTYGLFLWQSARNQPVVTWFLLAAKGAWIAAPSLAAFAVWIALAGWPAVREGVTNYGSASMVCPYWPTGIGLLGFTAGLAQGYLLYVVGAILSGRDAGGIYPERRGLFWGGAVISAGLVAWYLWAGWEDFPRYWAQPSLKGFSTTQIVASLAGLTRLMVVPMAWAVVLTVVDIAGWRAGRKLTPEGLLYASAAALGVRSLFGTLWTELPGVSPAAYCTLFVVAATLLHKAYQPATERAESWRARAAFCAPIALFLLFGAGRLAWFLVSERHVLHYPLETAAGQVVLSQPSSAEIYRYVTSHSESGEWLADVAYGGGVNFAARRRAPLFATLFSFVMSSDSIQALDTDRLVRHRPRFVIAIDHDNLGIQHGSGTTNGCVFPRIPWRSDRLAGDPARVLPLLTLLRDQYATRLNAGGYLILERRER